MKRTLLSLAFTSVAVWTIGCTEPSTEPTATATTEPSTEASADASTESHAGHGELVPEVDKAGLTAIMDENSVTFVDFTATWCGPCQKLKPTLHEMAEKYKGKVQFVEVDVDKSRDLAEQYEIQAMPTLIVMKDGKEMSRVVGGDVAAIEKSIEAAL